MEHPPNVEMNRERSRCVPQGEAPDEASPAGSERSRRVAALAALHELSERLTAATNYLASGLRLSERIMTDEARASRLTEIMEKTLAQVNRADDSVILLRKLLQNP